ncbi:hypothetical protein NM688_g6387 [Phlebia brevispora]|uniref:Uncharacterized protein n=1 Tax=Phlebia brevispora TaxID=194682 RepID=A0ACC1SGI6_9APHY|nr:hypothetical protein NM688_g6387 [Phlebia brevispora]
MSLSTSTTSTTAYTLVKYSRAYPSASKTQEGDAEWQHFTNPTIRLILDMRKKSSGELESYRCRVLWSLNSGEDAMDVDQNEVTFEDIELLSFSSPSLLQIQKQMFAVHGLPLKAVYRDAIVGIRYQHPRNLPPGVTPTFRRFQMNFQNASDASSFVDAIRPVCPCKANPPAVSAGLQNRSMTMLPGTSTAQKSASGSMPPPPESTTRQPLRSAMTMAPGPPTAPKVASVSMQPPSEPVNRHPLRSAATMQPSDTRPPAFPGREVAAKDSNSSCGPTDTPFVAVPPAQQHPNREDFSGLSRSSGVDGLRASESVEIPLNAFSGSDLPLVDLQSQGQISQTAPNALSGFTLESSISGGVLPGETSVPLFVPGACIQPYPSAGTNAETAVRSSNPRDQLLASLREVPPLYQLERAELETLVAQVVREDGFMTLASAVISESTKLIPSSIKLKTLDSMWTVKTFLGSAADSPPSSGLPAAVMMWSHHFESQDLMAGTAVSACFRRPAALIPLFDICGARRPCIERPSVRCPHLALGAMSVQMLPQELIDAVIDCLHDDKVSLVRCTEVCRAFLPAARRSLFEVLIINSKNGTFDDFVAFLQSTPHLRSLIRILHLKAEWSVRYSRFGLILNEDGTKLTIPTCATILSLLPRLQELSLSRIVIRSSEEVEGDLPSFHIPSCTFHNILVANERDALALLRVTSPKRLNIGNLKFIVPNIPPTIQEAETFQRDGCYPSEWALEDLSVPSSTDTAWLGAVVKATPAGRTLSSLDIEIQEEERIHAAEYLLDSVAPHLQHLHLHIVDLMFEQVGALALVQRLKLPACKALTSLTINVDLDLPAFSFIEHAVSATSDILERLTLEWDCRDLEAWELTEDLFPSNDYDREFSNLENAVLRCRRLQVFWFKSIVPTAGCGEQEVQENLVRRLPKVNEKGLLKFEVTVGDSYLRPMF